MHLPKLRTCPSHSISVSSVYGVVCGWPATFNNNGWKNLFSTLKNIQPNKPAHLVITNKNPKRN